MSDDDLRDELVRTALNGVMDPEIDLSVIDLELIREIVFNPDGSTEVRMLLTTPFCPYAPMIISQVTEATAAVTGGPVTVTILPDAWDPPPWLGIR